jgi:apolipoprotein N-acyltransferase
MSSVRQRAPVGDRRPSPRARPTFSVLLLVAGGGGFLAALAFPPLSVPAVALLGTALGLWAMLRAETARVGAACGFLWGVAFGAALFRWALALDLVAYLALVPVQAAFWAVTGALVHVVGRRTSGGWWVLGAAAAWTTVETVRFRWPLGGFEWAQLGWASADLPTRHAAAIVGTIGVTALTVALAAGLASLAIDRRRWRPLAVAAAATVALSGLGALGWTSPNGSLHVGVVQIDDPCPGAFAADCPGLAARQLDAFADGLEKLETDPDLMLWGEGTLREPTAEEAGESAVRATTGLPAPLLSGTVNRGGPGRFYQRNVLYDTDGGVLAVYSKRQPVPFGEYVPFRDVLGGIGDVGRLVPTDLVPGEGPVAMPVPVGDETVDLGTVVSWEVTFSRLVRDAARVGEAVAVLTTQGSYGPDQPVSDQLIGAAQLRAAEFGQSMVIAATTGRSVVVLPGGALASTPTALYAADTMEAEVPLRVGRTPFAWWGEAPVIVVAFLVTAGSLAGWGRRHRGRDGGPVSDAAAG